SKFQVPSSRLRQTIRRTFFFRFCPIDRMNRQQAFTLVELLVVVAIIYEHAALLLAVPSRPMERAKRTLCAVNLKQINLGVRMYTDDWADKAPRTPGTAASPGLNWSGYKNLMKSYVGAGDGTSTHDKLFVCPADTFHYSMAGNFEYVPKGMHEEAPDFMSYGFNG